MLVLGIDPGISNCGWAIVDVGKRFVVVDAGVESPVSRRQTKITKTRTGKRKKEVVPGSLSESENDTQRCGLIFNALNRLVSIRLSWYTKNRERPIQAIAVEDRTINAAWAASTKMTQQGVLVAVECVAMVNELPRDLIPVKDVHAALDITIPRRKSKAEKPINAKPIVEAAVRRLVDCSRLDAKLKPGKRVHAIDAIAVVIAAAQLEYARTYQLLWSAGDARPERKPGDQHAERAR